MQSHARRTEWSNFSPGTGGDRIEWYISGDLFERNEGNHLPTEATSTPISPAALLLCQAALQGRLTLCVGAGVSVASGLPSGSVTAQRVHAGLVGLLALPACDPAELKSVADAAEQIDALPTLQRRIVDDYPELTSAEPNFSHEALSTLGAEGAATLF